MDTPSQVTKVVAIAILIAVLLSILFTAFGTNKKLMLSSLDKQEEMNMANYGEDYNAYINTTIDGYKLRGLLKESVNKDIKIIIRFKDSEDPTKTTHTATFDFRQNSFNVTITDPDLASRTNSSDLQRKNFFLVDDSSQMGLDQMIGDIDKECWYIDPFATFTSSATVNGQTIYELYFDQIRFSDS